jgi:uncharacterized protein YhfF/predicted kinase
MSIEAIILSSDHRVYKGDFQKSESIHSIKIEMERMGYKIGTPIGVSPPQFCFLLEAGIPGEKPGDPYRHPEWVPLKEAIKSHDRVFNLYCDLMLGGWKPPTRELDVFFFGAPGFMSSKLAHLVAKGEKRLTAGWVASHLKSGMPIPEKGWVSIVTDGFGVPIACIETEAVDRIPFKDVTEAMAIREGEGDLTLEDWRAGHWDYWKKYDGPETGLEFDENELIFVESFKLLKVFSRKSIWDRPKIFMIVGLTGSGKTTFAKKLAEEQMIQIYSIDEWMRNLFWKDAKPDSDLNWALERCERCEIMIESLVREGIRNGQGCILDLGFSKRIERQNWFQKIKALGAVPQLIYLDVPKEIRWNRVEQRNQQLDQHQSSIQVDRATFDWMESYFEPLDEVDLKYTRL